jgi:hypothetical protein
MDGAAKRERSSGQYSRRQEGRLTAFSPSRSVVAFKRSKAPVSRLATPASRRNQLRYSPRCAAWPPRTGQAAIAQGVWELAVSADNGVDVTARLLAVLRELGIAPEEIQPRLAAELRRERFDTTDKARAGLSSTMKSGRFIRSRTLTAACSSRTL